MVVVQKTANEYLKLQAEALKLRPLTRLPDLEIEILDPMLRARVVVLQSRFQLDMHSIAATSWFVQGFP